MQISYCKNVEIVAICDVDLNRTVEARKHFPNAHIYQDWRKLLDREANNIDSVNVSTPDHMHAPIAVSAMQLGKHVYGQKPLAHEIHEVRTMTAMARQNRLVTQMGIQVHSSGYNRMAVGILQDGAIGRIREVHSWFERSWGELSARPGKIDPVPEGFDWDLWLGVCADRPFIGDGYYHPGNWRRRIDFGTGTLGDMGCHMLDPVLESLGLSAPVSVRSEGPAPNQWNWAPDSKVVFTFASTPRTAGGTLPVTWYDGAARPPAEIIALIEGDVFPKAAGSIFIGTEGVLLLPHLIDRPSLYPRAKFQDYKLPNSRGIKHWEQFVEACRGNGDTGADFTFAGSLTETILLGGIASRFPHATLTWDSAAMKFNLPQANRFVRREYRRGWEVGQLG